MGYKDQANVNHKNNIIIFKKRKIKCLFFNDNLMNEYNLLSIILEIN